MAAPVVGRTGRRAAARSFLLSLCVLAALVATGCHGGSSEQTATPPSPAPAAPAPAEPAPAEPAPAEPQPVPAEPVPAEPSLAEPAAEPVVTAHYQPIPIGPLEAGTTYATSAFAVPLTLRVSSRWQAPYVETELEFELKSLAEDYGLVFSAGTSVWVPGTS